MAKCKLCGSYAINPRLYGRAEGEDLDLCDVCYWRSKAEKKENINNDFKVLIKEELSEYLQHDSWRCSYYNTCTCGLDLTTDELGLERVPIPEFKKRGLSE